MHYYRIMRKNSIFKEIHIGMKHWRGRQKRVIYSKFWGE